MFMDIIKTLFYKTDENTNQIRISKTKAISIIVFVIFFFIAVYIYLTTPNFGEDNIILIIFAAIIFGLMFAIPVFIVGWLIGKFLNRNKKNNYSQDYTTQPNQNINQTEPEIQKNSNIRSNNRLVDVPCPHDYAKEFKEAVEKDDGDLAADLLSKWDENDANYKYASIIFEGMPPSKLGLTELNKMLNVADNMKACDESLREWFKSTALQVIELHTE